MANVKAPDLDWSSATKPNNNATSIAASQVILAVPAASGYTAYRAPQAYANDPAPPTSFSYPI